MLNARQDQITSFYQNYFAFSLLFSQKITTKHGITSTEISYQFLALKVPVLRRNKATNSRTLTDPFSAASTTLVLGNLVTFERFAITFARAFTIGDNEKNKTISLRLSYFLHLYPQVANFPCECDVKSKSLE